MSSARPKDVRAGQKQVPDRAERHTGPRASTVSEYEYFPRTRSSRRPWVDIERGFSARLEPARARKRAEQLHVRSCAETSPGAGQNHRHDVRVGFGTRHRVTQLAASNAGQGLCRHIFGPVTAGRLAQPDTGKPLARHLRSFPCWPGVCINRPSGTRVRGSVRNAKGTQ